jgi:hypothetical protein
MKPLHAFFISAILGVGLGWFGLGFVEAAAIILGAVIVVFAAERADDAELAHRPTAGWIGAIVLGASIAIAGAFDLFNAGRDTELGDWDTGFIFGLAILGPIALLHIWINRRRGKTQDHEGTGLVGLVVGVLVMDIAVADQWITVGRVGHAAIAAAAGFVTSIAAQIRARKAPGGPRLLGDLAAAALIATGLRVPLGLSLVSVALFGVAWGIAMLGVSYSRPERAPGSAIAVFKRSAVTGTLSAVLVCVLTLGALSPRADWSVAEAVAELEHMLPLPQSLFARLIMSDRYRWAHAPAREANNAGRDSNDLIEALRHPGDRWSGTLPASVSNAHLRGEDSEGVDFVEEDGVAVVGHVHPESPAAAAGVKRGWRLVRPDRFAAAKRKISFTDPGGTAHEVDVSHLLANVPASWWIVVEYDGRKVGYVYLSSFLPPSLDQLSSSFAALKREGVEDLVLDLRYNPGGSLNVSRHLASLIAGPDLEGKVFQRTIHNAKYHDRDRTARFRRHEEALGLKRVFVLTTRETCSASEAVITGLAPHIEVVTIGSATCGKPVGFSPLDYQGLSYWVIDFYLRNAADQGDYFDGLTPTCEVKEDLRQTLGAPDEALFAEALHYMSTGRCGKS